MGYQLKFKPIAKASKTKLKTVHTLDFSKQYRGQRTTTASPKIDVLQSVKEYLITGKFEVRYRLPRGKGVKHIVFLVDASNSMAKEKQIGMIKGIIQKSVETSQCMRIKYTAVVINEGRSEILFGPTIDNSGLVSSIAELRTSGKTDMVSALKKVKQVVKRDLKNTQLFIFTDGRFNAGHETPFEAAIRTYKTHLGQLQQTEVIDTEQGFVRLEKARLFAAGIHAVYKSVSKVMES